MWRFRKIEFERRMSDEMRQHLALRTADLMRSGLSEEEARRRARLEFGAAEAFKEECREASGFRFGDELRADLHYTFRTWRRSPGFVAVSLAILALAVSANTLLFTFFNAYVLRPLPVPSAERHVELRGQDASRSTRTNWSFIDYREFASSGVFESVYASGLFDVAMRAPVPARLKTLLVSANYLELLGGRTIMGRSITPDEESGAASGVAVVSYNAWQSIFHGDPNIVGTRLKLGDGSVTVIGVSDREFFGTVPMTPALWMPLGARDLLNRSAKKLVDPSDDTWKLGAFVKPGQTITEAEAAFNTVVRRANVRLPARFAITQGRLRLRDTYITLQPELRAVAVAIFLAFGLVLVIACANLASLMLARATARSREIVVRLSLGASRARIIRQLLTESLLLALLASPLAYGLAHVFTNRMQSYLFAIVLREGYDIRPVAPDARVFLFTALVALLAGVLFGLAPALQSTRPDLATGLKQQGGGAGRRHRLRELLVSGQVAASLVLLMAAGLLIRNAQRVYTRSAGYDLAPLIEIRPDGDHAAVARRLEQDPRVLSVSEVYRAPLYGGQEQLPATVRGRTEALGFNFVDDRYFDTMRVPIVRGRAIGPADVRGRVPVVVVSQATAQRLWPGEDPLGKTFQVPEPRSGESYRAGKFEVVGVAADVINEFFFRGPDATAVYFAAPRGDALLHGMIVRARDHSEVTLAAIRKVCADTPESGSCQPLPFDRLAWMQRYPYAIASTVATGLGALALLLTTIGLWGLTSYTVLQRTREIGIRMALGATPGDALRAIVGHSGRRVMAGMVVGLPLCLLVSQVASSLVVLTEPFDPFTYVATGLFLVLVAMLASWIPALAASRVDPVIALREE